MITIDIKGELLCKTLPFFHFVEVSMTFKLRFFSIKIIGYCFDRQVTLFWQIVKISRKNRNLGLSVYLLHYRAVGRFENPGGGGNVVGIICPYLIEIGSTDH